MVAKKKDEAEILAGNPGDADHPVATSQPGEAAPEAVDAAERVGIPVTDGPDADEVPLPDEVDASEYVQDNRAVTMADVAALNGIGLAPDASITDVVMLADVAAAGVFVSEGMRTELEQRGYAASPLDGRMVVTQETLDKVKAARKERDKGKDGK